MTEFSDPLSHADANANAGSNSAAHAHGAPAASTHSARPDPSATRNGHPSGVTPSASAAFAALADLEADLAGFAENMGEVAPAGVFEMIERFEILSRRMRAVRAKLLTRANDGGLWAAAGGAVFLSVDGHPAW